MLDAVWDNDGVKHCLESGQWHFAKRSVRLDYDPAYDPEFGYRRQFAKPTDWCSTMTICSDEYFRVPLFQYEDEAGFIYADVDEIYFMYVSNDTAYGGDLSLWTAQFADFVGAHFAFKTVRSLTQSDEKEKRIEDIRNMFLRKAKNHNKMGDPVKFPPAGNWVRSRLGRGNPRRDGGSNSSLIG